MIGARTPLQSVAILGGGQVALLAAIAMRRVFPDCAVTVIGSPVGAEDLADLAITALPFTNRLHDRLGVAEELMVRHAGASHRLVTRYGGWAGEGSSGVAAYGSAMSVQLRTAFARHWGGAARRGDGGAGLISLSEALARAGRFAPPQGNEQGGLADLDYALRWQREGYEALLVSLARQLGVALRPVALGEAKAGENGIDELHLVDGTCVSADLYLDCSGAGATLLSALPDYGWTSWQKKLPVRQIATTRSARQQLRLDDRIILSPVGWVAEIAGTSGQEAVLGLAPGVDAAVANKMFGGADVQFTELSSGRVDAAWLGNVVAIGDAAVRIDPLGWTNLDIAHRIVDLLLEMLPGSSLHPLERAEFNRRFALIADHACDLVACHYAAPTAKAMYGEHELSQNCAVMIDQFHRRGKLPFVEEAPLAGREWHGVMKALGHHEGIDAVTLAQPLSSHEAELAAHQRSVNAVLEQMPAYQDWYRSIMMQG